MGSEMCIRDRSKKKLGNRPVDFPTDEDLLLQGTDYLKSFVKRAVADNMGLVKN